MFHDTECEHVQWCQLSKSFLNNDEDLMLYVVYITTENTRYFKQNIVDLLYADLESFRSSHTNVLLMGDFRARTATVDNIAIPDTHIFDFIDVGDSHIIDDDSFSEIYKSNTINISRKTPLLIELAGFLLITVELTIWLY